MDCGCHTPTAQWLRPHAAMCHVCIYADHDCGGRESWHAGATSCTIDGKPVVGRESCPRRKFEVGKQVYRWCFLDWYGVPYPIRVALWVAHPRHPKPSSFAGCGCLKFLKDAWENLWTRNGRLNTQSQMRRS